MIINQFEKDTFIFAEMKIYQPILYDLKSIRYCYEKVKTEEKYFQIFDALIDIGIISKETYLNIEYKDFFFKKRIGINFSTTMFLQKGFFLAKIMIKKYFLKKKLIYKIYLN